MAYNGPGYDPNWYNSRQQDLEKRKQYFLQQLNSQKTYQPDFGAADRYYAEQKAQQKKITVQQEDSKKKSLLDSLRKSSSSVWNSAKNTQQNYWNELKGSWSDNGGFDLGDIGDVFKVGAKAGIKENPMFDQIEGAIFGKNTEAIDQTVEKDGLLKGIEGVRARGGSNFTAGVGDLVKGTGDALKWLGGKDERQGVMDEWGKSLSQFGQDKLITNYEKPYEKEFNFASLLDPEFYSSSVARTLPFMMSMIAPSIVGAKVGAAIGGSAANFTKMGNWGKKIMKTLGAGVGGSAVNVPFEAMFEAGSAYDEAIQKGMTPDQADDIADGVFKKNAALLAATSVPEMAATFGHLGGFRPGKIARLGTIAGSAAIEGGQEVGQELISANALGEEAPSHSLWESFAVGALMGGGMSAVGQMGSREEAERILGGADPNTVIRNDVRNLLNDQERAELNDVRDQLEANGITGEELENQLDEFIATLPRADELIQEATRNLQNRLTPQNPDSPNVEQEGQIQPDINQALEQHQNAINEAVNAADQMQAQVMGQPPTAQAGQPQSQPTAQPEQPSTQTNWNLMTLEELQERKQRVLDAQQTVGPPADERAAQVFQNQIDSLDAEIQKRQQRNQAQSNNQQPIYSNEEVAERMKSMPSDAIEAFTQEMASAQNTDEVNAILTKHLGPKEQSTVQPQTQPGVDPQLQQDLHDAMLNATVTSAKNQMNEQPLVSPEAQTNTAQTEQTVDFPVGARVSVRNFNRESEIVGPDEKNPDRIKVKNPSGSVTSVWRRDVKLLNAGETVSSIQTEEEPEQPKDGIDQDITKQIMQYEQRKKKQGEKFTAEQRKEFLDNLFNYADTNGREREPLLVEEYEKLQNGETTPYEGTYAPEEQKPETKPEKSQSRDEHHYVYADGKEYYIYRQHKNSDYSVSEVVSRGENNEPFFGKRLENRDVEAVLKRSGNHAMWNEQERVLSGRSAKDERDRRVNEYKKYQDGSSPKSNSESLKRILDYSQTHELDIPADLQSEYDAVQMFMKNTTEDFKMPWEMSLDEFMKDDRWKAISAKHKEQKQAHYMLMPNGDHFSGGWSAHGRNPAAAKKAFHQEQIHWQLRKDVSEVAPEAVSTYPEEKLDFENFHKVLKDISVDAENFTFSIKVDGETKTFPIKDYPEHVTGGANGSSRGFVGEHGLVGEERKKWKTGQWNIQEVVVNAIYQKIDAAIPYKPGDTIHTYMSDGKRYPFVVSQISAGRISADRVDANGKKIGDNGYSMEWEEVARHQSMDEETAKKKIEDARKKAHAEETAKANEERKSKRNAKYEITNSQIRLTVEGNVLLPENVKNMMDKYKFKYAPSKGYYYVNRTPEREQVTYLIYELLNYQISERDVNNLVEVARENANDKDGALDITPRRIIFRKSGTFHLVQGVVNERTEVLMSLYSMKEMDRKKKGIEYPETQAITVFDDFTGTADEVEKKVREAVTFQTWEKPQFESKPVPKEEPKEEPKKTFNNPYKKNDDVRYNGGPGGEFASRYTVMSVVSDDEVVIFQSNLKEDFIFSVPIDEIEPWEKPKKETGKPQHSLEDRKYMSLSPNPADIKAIAKAQPPNILLAYDKWGKVKKKKGGHNDRTYKNHLSIKKLVEEIGYTPENIILDSGAFAFWNNENILDDPIYGPVQDAFFELYGDLDREEIRFIVMEHVKEFAQSGKITFDEEQGPVEANEFIKYVDWVQSSRLGIDSTFHVMSFDRVGDPDTSWMTYNALAGIFENVIPTFHYGSDMKYLEEYVRDGADYIALGGSAKGVKFDDRVAWANEIVNKYPKVRFHMLGTMNEKLMAAVPGLYSLDGSGWVDKTKGNTSDEKVQKSADNINKKLGKDLKEGDWITNNKTGVTAKYLGLREDEKMVKADTPMGMHYWNLDGFTKETNIVTTQAGTEVPVKYRILEVSHLLTSHTVHGNINKKYPKELQPRDRSAQDSRLQISEMARNLDPQRLGESRMASDGAPIIGFDGAVESGNGRTLAIMEMYDQFADDNEIAYRDFLKEFAEKHNLQVDVDEMQMPILVRMRLNTFNNGQRVKFAAEANESSVSRMGATETALADAKKLKPIIHLFVPSESGEINTAANQEFIKNYINEVVPSSERREVRTKEGYLSQDGKERLERALFALAYPNDRAIARYSEDLDDNARTVTGAMTDVAPKMAVVNAEIENGAILSEFELSKDVVDAFNQLVELRRKGEKIPQWIKENKAQTSMFEDAKLSDASYELLEQFDKLKSRTKIRAILANYVEYVLNDPRSTGQDLFGDRATKEEFLQIAIERMNGGGDLFELQTETRPSKTKNDGESAGKKARETKRAGTKGLEKLEDWNAYKNKHKMGSIFQNPVELKTEDLWSLVENWSDANFSGYDEKLRKAYLKYAEKVYNLVDKSFQGQDFTDEQWKMKVRDLFESQVESQPEKAKAKKVVNPLPEDATKVDPKHFAEYTAKMKELIAEFKNRVEAGNMPQGKAVQKEIREIATNLLGRPAQEDEWRDALEAALQSVYVKRTKDMDIKAKIANAQELEGYLKTSGRSMEQMERQQFSTPIPLAEIVRLVSGAKKTDWVKEGSAGTGSLIMPLEKEVEQIQAIELSPRRAAILTALGFDVINKNTFEVSGLQADLVVGNPPFKGQNKGGKSVELSGKPPWKGGWGDLGNRFLAWDLRSLKDGGRLVYVVSGGVIDNQQNAEFRKWLKANHTVLAMVKFPSGVYDTRGTSFPTGLIVVEKGKKADAPAPITGNFETLDGLLDALQPLSDQQAVPANVQPNKYDKIRNSKPMNRLDRLAAKADQYLKDNKDRINALPLDLYAAAAIVGAKKIADGVIDFAEWSEQMMNDYGSKLRLSLRSLYVQSEDISKFSDDDLDEYLESVGLTHFEDETTEETPADETPDIIELVDEEDGETMTYNVTRTYPNDAKRDYELHSDEKGEGWRIQLSKAMSQRVYKSQADPIILDSPQSLQPFFPTGWKSDIAMASTEFQKLLDGKPFKVHFQNEESADRLLEQYEKWIAERKKKDEVVSNKGKGNTGAGNRSQDSNVSQPESKRETATGSKSGSKQQSSGGREGTSGTGTVHGESNPSRTDGGSRGSTSSLDPEQEVVSANVPNKTSEPNRGDSGGTENKSTGGSTNSDVPNAARYIPRRVVTGVPHMGNVTEAPNMRFVKLPDDMFRDEYLPHPIVVKGGKWKLSDVQIETVMAAKYNFDMGKRGILLADDTGMGKTAQQLGIAADAWHSGRTKRILVVTTKDQVATSSFIPENENLGFGLPITWISPNNKEYNQKHGKNWKDADFQKGEDYTPFQVDDGVIVMSKTTFRDSQESIIKWLGDSQTDVTILMDESHEFANRESGLGKANVRIFQAFKDKAQYVYSSATAAEEIDGLEHLYGLHKWTTDGFGEFKLRLTSADSKAKVGKRKTGMSGAFDKSGKSPFKRDVPLTMMEQITRELKMDGQYIGRQLSLEGIAMEGLPIKISPKEMGDWNRAVQFVGMIAQKAETYGRSKDGEQNPKARGQIISQVVGYMRRLSGYYRMKAVIADIQKQMDAGTFQRFGIIGEFKSGDDGQPANLFAAINAINTEDPVDTGDDIVFADIPEAIEDKEYLFNILHGLNPEWGEQPVPVIPSPMQMLYDAFGEENVAVVSGDVKANERPKVVKEFQEMKKNVIWFNSAGGTGVNMHDTIGTPIRVYTQDYPYNAKAQKQAEGRFNRTGQVTKPTYVYPYLNSSSDTKFVGTLIARYESMGALSRGDVGKLGGDELANFDMTGEAADIAVLRVIPELDADVRAEMFGEFTRDVNFIDDQNGGFDETAAASVFSGNAPEVKKFLNALMFLEYEASSRVFEQFTDKITEVERELEEKGGVKDKFETFKGKELETQVGKNGIRLRKIKTMLTKNQQRALDYALEEAQKNEVTMEEEYTKTRETTLSKLEGQVEEMERKQREDNQEKGQLKDQLHETMRKISVGEAEQKDADRIRTKFHAKVNEINRRHDRLEETKKKLKGLKDGKEDIIETIADMRRAQVRKNNARLLRMGAEANIERSQDILLVDGKIATNGLLVNIRQAIRKAANRVYGEKNTPSSALTLELRGYELENGERAIGAVVPKWAEGDVAQALEARMSYTGEANDVKELQTFLKAGNKVSLQGGFELEWQPKLQQFRINGMTIGKHKDLFKALNKDGQVVGYHTVSQSFTLPTEDGMKKFIERYPILEKKAKNVTPQPSQNVTGDGERTIRGIRVRVTKSKHTQTGADIWLVKTLDTVAGKDWAEFAGNVKKHGGTYYKANAPIKEFRSQFVFQKDPEPVFDKESSGTGGSGNVETVNTFIPLRRPSNDSSSSTDETVTRSEILNHIRKEFKVQIGTGRYRKRAQGLYKRIVNEIRTKNFADFVVLAHELGHRLDSKFNLSDTAHRQELIDLANQNLMIPENMPENEQAQEGLAEFVRLYLYNRPAIMGMDFYGEFIGEMEAERLIDPLEKLTGMLDTWTGQSAEARVDGVTDVREKRKKPKKASDYYADIVEELIGLKHATDKLKGNRTLTGRENPFLLAQRTRGTSGKIQAFLEHGVVNEETGEKIAPGFKEILESVPDIAVLRRYLNAKHALTLHEEGKYKTPITETDAETVIQNADNESPEYANAADALYEFQDHVTRELVASGILKESTVDEWNDKYPFYVPFYRVMEESGERESGQTKGEKRRHQFANSANPVKAMKETGSARNIIDPLESIMKNTFMYLNLAQRNDVGAALANLLGENSADIMVEVDPKSRMTAFNLEEIEKDIMQVLNESGLSLTDTELDLNKMAKVFRPFVAPSMVENIVTVWKNGERKLYEVRDEELYRALTAMDNEVIWDWVKMLALPNNILRAGITLSPSFIPRGPIRSIPTMMMQSQSYTTPMDYLRLFPDIWSGLISSVKQDNHFWDWLSAGGAQSTLLSIEREYFRDAKNRMLFKPNVSKVLKQAFLSLGTIPTYKFLRHVSNTMDEAVRIAEYRQARRKGADRVEAAIRSREVDVDFSRFGRSTKNINRVSLFFNIAIQGPDRFMREIKSHPMRSLLRGSLFIMLPTILLMQLNKDDEDYWELEQWERDLFWNIPIGDGKFFKIPIPFEWGFVFKVVPERLLYQAGREDRTAFDDFFKSISTSMVPSLLPTAFVPFLEWMTEKDFSNWRSTVQPYDNRPPEEQVNDYTTDFAKWLGKTFQVPPTKIDQFAGSLGGTLGNMAMGGVSAFIPNEHGEKPSSDKGVMERAFIADSSDGNTFSSTAFYEGKEKLEKDHKKNGVKGEPGPEVQYARDAAEYLTDLRHLRTLARTDKTMSGAEKGKHIESINKAIRDLSRLGTGKEPFDYDNMAYYAKLARDNRDAEHEE